MSLPSTTSPNSSSRDTRLAMFMSLPIDIRLEAERRQSLFEAFGPGATGAAKKKLAEAVGITVRHASRKLDEWLRSGRDPMTLVDRRVAPNAQVGLDPEFLEWWKGLCEKNGRKCRPAYRAFVRAFLAGDLIPGLDPGIPRRLPLPRGYSENNLLRHKPTKFELVSARIGRSASAPYRPLVLTTRVGLNVGRRYIFDDLWHDFKVVVVGQRHAVRLLQLHAHDLFSGCQFARGIKPRIFDHETGQSVGLNSGEMLFLLAHVLGSFGYHPDGCVLMVEHGTAAIDSATASLIADLTGGLVTVEESGIEGMAAFAGQYPGRSKGNFRFKASLESLGNLIHNETAGLMEFPGQTGSNSRINLPEELAGRERSLDLLQRAILALPPRVAADLQKPFVESTQATLAIERVMELINRRTDHDLEGWIESGLTTVDFEMPGIGVLPGSELAKFDEPRRKAVEAIATPIARRLSPREVFDSGRRRLVRLRPEAVARLLHGRCGREVTVGDDRLICFEDKSISPSPLRYLAHTFAPGDRFTIVVNPFSAQEGHLFDARGAWRGVVTAWQAVSRDDIAGLHAQMGEAAKIASQLLAPVARRGADLTRKRLAETEHNNRTISEHQAAQSDLGAAADEALRNSML
jgi:hypothetical protein